MALWYRSSSSGFPESRSIRCALFWSTPRGARWLPPKCAYVFDQSTAVPLREFLAPHEVSTAYERGWSRLKTGELLDAAESEGFALLVTTDAKLRFQQNLDARRVSIVVLLSTSWPRIEKALGAVRAAIDAALPGSYTEVQIP